MPHTPPYTIGSKFYSNVPNSLFGQWLWRRSWYSGCFLYQRSVVRIQSSTILFNSNCLIQFFDLIKELHCKDKNIEPVNGPVKKLSKSPYFQSRFVCLLFFKSEFILRLLVQSFNISFRIYQSKLSELFICSLAASIYCEHHTVSLFLSVSPFPVYSYIKSGIF